MWIEVEKYEKERKEIESKIQLCKKEVEEEQLLQQKVDQQYRDLREV